MRVLDGGRISIAALSLGMAEGAYEPRCIIRNSAANSEKPLAISGDSMEAG